MKKRALNKDFRMEVRTSLNRFLSILLIVALGVAFFSGIQSSAPDMRVTEDAYFDDSNLMDIRVISTLGLDEEDIEALLEVEGISAAEGSYMEDAFSGDAEIGKVLHVESLPGTMNQLAVADGRLPQKAGECFLDQYYAESEGLGAGDTLVLSPADEDSTSLKRTSFTIVGTGYSPCYIAHARGSTTLGTGELSGFVYVCPEDFDAAAYSVVYLGVEGAKEKTAYTGAYDELVAEARANVEAIEKQRCDKRYASVKDEAEKEIADAKQEIEDGRKEVADAKAELADARKEAESELAEAESELLEGESELEEGKKELEDARSELEAGEAELAAGEEEYAAGEAEIADARAQLSAALESLNAGEAEYQSGLAEYQSQQSSASRQLQEAQAEIDAGEAELSDGRAEYEAGLSELEAGEAALKEAEKQLSEGQASYQEAKAKLDAAQNEYERYEEEAAGGQAAYDSAAAAVSALQRSYDSASAEADALAGEVAEEEQTIASLQAQRDEARSRQEAYLQEAAGYEEQISGIEGSISQNESRIAELEASLENGALTEEERQEIEQMIAALSAENEGLTAERSALSKARDSAQANAADAADTAAALEGQIADEQGVLAQSQAACDEAADAASSLAAQLAAAESRLSEAKAELDAADAALASAKKELDAGWAALSASEKELQEAQAEISRNRQALYDARAALSDAKAEIESAEAELEAAQKEVDAGYAALSTARAQLSSARAQLDAGWAEYYAGLDELQSGQRQLEEGRFELEEGRQELAEAVSQLAEAEEEIAENEQKLADGWKEYEEGSAEADQEIAEAEQEIADAERELLDGEKEVQDAEEALLKLSYPSWYVNDRSILPDNSGYGENADRMSNIAQVFPVIFFLVAALICLTTMTRMVDEERTQIGTLKALGYGKLDIAKKFLKYAFWATVAGSIFGFVLGEKLIPWVIIQAYGMMYLYSPAILVPFNWSYGFAAAGISLLCTIGATIYSCYRALSEVPAELMRPPSPKAGKRVWLEHLPFIWNHLSFSWKSSIRNLMRYKGRFFMTVFGIGGCMGLLLVGFGLRDSIMDIGLLQYNELQNYKAMLVYDPDASQKDLTALKEAVESETAVSDYKYFHMQNLDVAQEDSSGSGKQWSLYVYVPEDMENLDEFLLFRDRRTKKACALDDEGAIITEKIAKEFGLAPGDTITLAREDADPVEVRIAAVCENYLAHYLYMTPALYEECFGEAPVDNSIFICSDADETTVESIGSRLLSCDAAVNVTYTKSLIQEIDDMLSALDLVILVLIIAAGLLAFVVLYNLNNININERQRELATIKVLGFYDSEVAAYVYRENIVLTFIGVIAGCLIGRALHAFIITTVEVDSTMFGRVLYPQSYLYGTLFTIVFSLIVNFVMYFKLKKIDMVESLKSIE